MKPEAKLTVLERLENKSAREAEKELVAINPQVAKQSKEKVRELTFDLTEVQIVFDRETMEEIEKLKELMAHQNPSLSVQGLLKLLTKTKLRDLTAKKTEKPSQKAKQLDAALRATSVVETKPVPRKSIPVAVQREVWQRDKGKCQFVHPVSQKKCESKHFIEYDHIERVRHGGSNEPENIRLVCRVHNRWRG